ncbi:DUF6075 family protein [Paenibacillus hamazuiensis]|uniref:DUF6075 family protein n=1 Tax=Paenibacillus hamazuiensis TaxID=2936508 RepID=UPI00200BDCAC|nr:DUF6075 family protein [Paenibacillus hamazuiensis]
MYQFLNIKHEERFAELCKRARINDNDIERRSLFFVLSGNDSLYKNVESIYDFEENSIRLEVFNEPWLTSGTRSLIELAFNLYNAACAECSVCYLFRSLDERNSILAIEAIKLRFQIGEKKTERRTWVDRHENFVSLVLYFLADEVVKAEEYYYNSVTVNLKDVNFQVNGVKWEQALQEYMEGNGYTINFEYGDGNWVTVNKK